MSLKDAYREKLQAQIEEQCARLELLRAKAKRAVAEGKIIAYEEFADADQKLAALQAKFKHFTEAGGGAWQDMKGGVEKALADLGESCKNAAGHFRE